MFHFWEGGTVFRLQRDRRRTRNALPAAVLRLPAGLSLQAGRAVLRAARGAVPPDAGHSVGCGAAAQGLPAPVPATGICYAEGLAKGLGNPMVNALEKLHRPNNRTLCFADVERRTGLIRDHLKLTGEDLQGKEVVVVDGAIFTGTTLRIVCQMLREAGAAKVHIAIPTPMSNCRCAQYVLPAMPSLADSMPPSKMLDYFGADSLTYIPGQSFLEIARPSGAVCTDCFEA